MYAKLSKNCVTTLFFIFQSPNSTFCQCMLAALVFIPSRRETANINEGVGGRDGENCCHGSATPLSITCKSWLCKCIHIVEPLFPSNRRSTAWTQTHIEVKLIIKSCIFVITFLSRKGKTLRVGRLYAPPLSPLHFY